MKNVATKIGLCFLLLFALGTTSFAKPYMAASAGYSMLSDATMTSNASISGEISYKPGSALALAVGNDLGSMRLEGEVSFRKNTFDDFSNGASSMKMPGYASTLCYMFNVYKDFDLEGSWTPYVGAGAGMSFVEANVVYATVDDMVFAYQAIAGASFKMTDDLSLEVSYRYLATTDPSYTFDDGSSMTGTYDAEYASHALLVGIRKSF